MGDKKITVVIPTLQKNITILTLLLNSLEKDNLVDEIIVVDNSLKGINSKSTKLNVIKPDKNLYVNPSWNLGVEKAKNDIVVLLNDDIIIPENFCSSVVHKITPDMGIVGMNGMRIEPITDINKRPPMGEVYLQPTTYMDWYWGIALFFYKSSYFKIPEEIKIVYGDCWLFTSCKKLKKQNYRICGCTIYHYGSLSSGEKNFNKIAKNDSKIYKKLTVKWYNRIFSYEELWEYHKFRILGITIRLRKKGINAPSYVKKS